MGENQLWEMLQHAAERKMAGNQRWEMLQHTAELKKAGNQCWEMLQHTAEPKKGENQRWEMLRGRQLPCVCIAKWPTQTIAVRERCGATEPDNYRSRVLRREQLVRAVAVKRRRDVEDFYSLTARMLVPCSRNNVVIDRLSLSSRNP